MLEPRYGEVKELVLQELSLSLGTIKEEEVEHLLEIVLSSRKVFFVGVGRVLLSLQAVAKRWAHLGIDTHIVGEITEPAITSEDVLVVGSGSGTTLFPASIARKAYQDRGKSNTYWFESKQRIKRFCMCYGPDSGSYEILSAG